jgi:Protein of unknown function (DUF3141)
VRGRNPMRYSGGLLGGSWLTALASDLGGGLFDGATLVQNFESQKPANTLWTKHFLRHLLGASGPLTDAAADRLAELATLFSVRAAPPEVDATPRGTALPAPAPSGAVQQGRDR